ncbi:FHA domain-containing protein [Cryobacterium sp. TMS1-20-1]|uniref:FHA domain-containing protein FhaB/FipA n=1 Tax=Cryobacterium sp. TMS1-20-1 TaxID=1259223 RepID=UPI00106A17FC|nr:FHA domain-containing protein [Cryobacterium sp. TMS1-20-1]TFC74121.1 FHA domain-containing protein [Cryobacterium sp. TMS1-20-1]
MSELTLLVLRIGFLLLLWMFIFGIVYALRSDLFGQRVRRLKTDVAAPAPAAAFPAAAPIAAPAPTPAPAPIARASPAADGALATAQNTTRLVITSGPKSGTEFPLSTETITIGRSADSSLVIRDDYTSTHHARLMLWHDEWMLQDLDSTNGTFLAGTRVTVPTKIPLNATVKIGATSFELRR